jgi:ureidoacrylate peracid hydrolase
MQIVYLKMGFLRDLSDLGAEDVPNGFLFLHLGVKDGVLERETWGTDILDELTPSPDDAVIYKTRFSGFYKTELDELLTSWGTKHLVVTGCTTSICVESTVRDAFFRDYHCIVLEDCTAEPMGLGLSRSNHEATTMLFERIFASVSSSSDFVRALERATAATV